MKQGNIHTWKIITLVSILLFTYCSSGNNTGIKNETGETEIPADTLLNTAGKLPFCIEDSLFIETTRQPLTDSFVIALLYGGSDTFDVRNFWSNEFLYTEPMKDHLSENKYYLLDTLVRTNNFLVLLFQRQEEESREKFIVTVNHANKIIDRFRVAYHSRMGNYTTSDGGRAPFFKQSGSCINKDLTIDTWENGRYMIETTGRIMLAK